MTQDTPHERRYHGGADRLRAPDRVALLEVPRVVQLCLDGFRIVSMLDVGTGTGIFAEAFAAGGVSATGIDPDPELLARARELVRGALFRQGIAERLPFPDHAFDLVFMGHVLHETDDPSSALAEARRVARHRVAILEWPYLDEQRGPPLAHRLEPSRILELVERAGFTAVDHQSLSHMQLYRCIP